MARKRRRPRPIPEIDIIETMQPAPSDLDLSKPWYLVFTRPRGEEEAASGLAEAGCQVFWPHFVRTTKRKNKPEISNKVSTFRRYLFASGAPMRQRFRDRVLDDNTVITINGRPLDDIRQIDGVLYVISNAKGWCPVPRRALEFVIRQHGPTPAAIEPETPAKPTIAPGQGVKVIDGPFMGFHATVMDSIGKHEATVLISLFGTEVPAQMDLAQIEAA